MGCFLGCFGFTKKKKRRKPGKKSPEEQNHGSYAPLDSDVSIMLDNKEDTTSDSVNQLKENPKEPLKSKTKKKVRFNLNVKAYEPIPNDDHMDIMYLSDSEEETKWEFNAETKSISSLHYGDVSIASSTNSSYRYQNCRDSYNDEDDELKLDENDLNFDEIEDIDEEVDDLSSDESNDGILEEKNTKLEHLFNLQNKELQGFRSKLHSREREPHVFPVLNPAENLNQWEVVKAKASTQQLKCEKENLIMPLQERESPSSRKPNFDSFDFKKMRNIPNVCHHRGDTFAVDASLWLGSLETHIGTKHQTNI